MDNDFAAPSVFKKRLDAAVKTDVIQSPSHYTQGNVECIDAIEAATTDLNGIQAVCTANVIKYIWRWKRKNGLQDLNKAQWYLSKLIKEVENNEKSNSQGS